MDGESKSGEEWNLKGCRPREYHPAVFCPSRSEKGNRDAAHLYIGINQRLANPRGKGHMLHSQKVNVNSWKTYRQIQ
jgi:hypothetical protein